MKVFLAATNGLKKDILSGGLDITGVYILESYYTIKDWQVELIPKMGDFLLDSGAFTFMQNSTKHGSTDWLSYADAYADFVKSNRILKYLELDIDSVKGLKYVEMLRDRIEARVGWQSIPVWHTERGKEYYLDMVRNYKYVALGSIAKVLPPKIPITDKYFPWFIQEAHERGVKVHALGYTSLTGLRKYHFDSVDSSTWSGGSRYGVICQYVNGSIKKHVSVLGGVKTRNITDPKGCNLINFREWVKFQKWAEKNI